MSTFYTNVRVIGNNICYRGIENGLPVKFKTEYSPKLYIQSHNESKFKTLEGNYVSEVNQGSINLTKDFIKQYSVIDNFEIYGDIGFDTQYIADKFKGEIGFDIDKISIHIVDIEVSVELGGFPCPLLAEEEILLISMLDMKTGKVTTFTSRPYTGEPLENVTIVLCENEKSLLRHFIDHWNRVSVDIISGYNCKTFDIPYIINRISRILGDAVVKELSPWGMVNSRTTKGNFGKEETVYDIAGVSCLDMLDLYKKYTYTTRENYTLDFICQEELGVGKLDHSEFVGFKDFYTNGWDKYLEYNTIDVKRVVQLESKLKLIELVLTMSYLAKINYTDAFSAIKMWDVIIYNHLRENNVVIPKKMHNSKSEQFEGAYVKEPIPGLYMWGVSFDAASLYPSIIQGWNISPETFIGMSDTHICVDKLINKEYDNLSLEYCTAASGAMYSKTKQGLFPDLVDLYMSKRVSAKKKMLAYESELEILKTRTHTDAEYNDIKNLIAKYNNYQMAYKIAMNSLYGILGNSHFRYYKLENARSITLTGQYIIKSVERGVNLDLDILFGVENYPWTIYQDTDSSYITLKPIVDKFFKKKSSAEILEMVDKICKEKITPMINKHCEALENYTNNFRKTIVFKRESIFSSGVFVAKKRYFMNVLDNEGVRYTTPKLKVMGLEVVKSSTPGVIRKTLKVALSVILDEGEGKIQEYISKCKSDFSKFSIEEISFPRGCNGLSKYSDSVNIYSKGTPIHTKGSLLYNNKLVELGLESKYPKIGEGDKVKYTYLREPNPMKNSVISYPIELPVEFGLHKYVDYNMQFEKSFLAPLRNILDTIGWKTERTMSIEDFF